MINFYYKFCTCTIATASDKLDESEWYYYLKDYEYLNDLIERVSSTVKTYIDDNTYYPDGNLSILKPSLWEDVNRIYNLLGIILEMKEIWN